MVYRLLIFFSFFGLLSCQNHKTPKNQERYTNDLIRESSPYLLQHAHNPVNWKAWNQQTLQQARAEDKLIVVSVGYAACHWCHVMEAESFEDTTVANFMNRHFINIKVDREERPDIDDIYMSACQLTSEEGCGWPLNAIALPDGKPIWAGTYFPKNEWLDILRYFVQARDKNPEQLEAYAQKLTAGIRISDSIIVNNQAPEIGIAAIEQFAEQLLSQVDHNRGGLKGQLKFPMPGNYQFLLFYNKLTGNPEALQAVELTLDNMLQGGIFDHLGGGFARYSTDTRWKVPHFEKMLYDNAQLLELYARAYQVTKKEKYKKGIEKTVAFLNRRLLDKSGAYYSSVNADSEGEEGKYYVWTYEEIEQIINDTEAFTLFAKAYNIKKGGNWEDGKNVLHQEKTTVDLSKILNVSVTSVETSLESSKEKLFKARNERILPSIDNKILASWNALLIKGLAAAYMATSKDGYYERALAIGHFIERELIKEDFRMDRNFKDGQSSINGFLEDYAFTIDAFIDLYQITFDEKWINLAEQLTKHTLQHFSGTDSPFFHFTSDLDPPLIASQVKVNDNVIPSANSVMANNLYKLGLLLYKKDYTERSKAMVSTMQEVVLTTDEAAYFYNWAFLLLQNASTTHEVVIMGKEWKAKTALLFPQYLPNAIFMGGDANSALPLTENKFIEGKNIIYVCQNRICKLPVESADKALELLSDNRLF